MLLRHGRTAHNVSGRIQGQLDVELDDVGRAQAVAVAEVFAAVCPLMVLSSDLSRARQTADAVAGRAGLPVVADQRLREIALGRWEGLTSQEAAALFPEEHRAWFAGEDVARGGGETYREVGQRARECLSAAVLTAPAGSTIVAVTHGGTARGALGSLLELDPKDWWRLAPLGNTCWSTLVEAGRGWRLERHNSSLEPLVGAVPGAHDLGARPSSGRTARPHAGPVK